MLITENKIHMEKKTNIKAKYYLFCIAEIQAHSKVPLLSFKYIFSLPLL